MNPQFAKLFPWSIAPAADNDRDASKTPSTLPPAPLVDAETERLIRETWARIEAALDKRDPKRKRALRSPGTYEAIERAEKTLGLRFPPEFRASLCVHDGEAESDAHVEPPFRLRSLRALVADWLILEEQRESRDFVSGAPQEHGNRGWIPIASDDNDNSWHLDMAPPTHEHAGQIVLFVRREGAVKIAANSFLEWLRSFADALEKA